MQIESKHRNQDQRKKGGTGFKFAVICFLVSVVLGNQTGFAQTGAIGKQTFGTGYVHVRPLDVTATTTTVQFVSSCGLRSPMERQSLRYVTTPPLEGRREIMPCERSIRETSAGRIWSQLC